MTEDVYQEFLKTIPDPMTDEFLTFLKEKNEVISESHNWLVIKNCKYDTWQTAFWKGPEGYRPETFLWEVIDQYPDCEFRIKAKVKRSIKRFHLHIINK